MNRRLIFGRCLSTFPLFTLSINKDYSVLPHVSMGYPQYKDRLSTCYSPVRHSLNSASTIHTVRLACLKRAASVRSEPGSNSPLFSMTCPKDMPPISLPSLSFSLIPLPFPVKDHLSSRLTPHQATYNLYSSPSISQDKIIIFEALTTIEYSQSKTISLLNQPR